SSASVPPSASPTAAASRSLAKTTGSVSSSCTSGTSLRPRLAEKRRTPADGSTRPATHRPHCRPALSRLSCSTRASSSRATGSFAISSARPLTTSPDLTQLAPTSTAKNASAGKRDLAQPRRVVRVEALRLGEREREELTRDHREQRGEQGGGRLRHRQDVGRAGQRVGGVAAGDDRRAGCADALG